MCIEVYTSSRNQPLSSVAYSADDLSFMSTAGRKQEVSR